MPSSSFAGQVSPTGWGSVDPKYSRPSLRQLELVSQGMRNKEIAASLGISEETVQVHLRNIYLKLNVNDRTAVLAVAVRRGLIHLK